MTAVGWRRNRSVSCLIVPHTSTSKAMCSPHQSASPSERAAADPAG